MFDSIIGFNEWGKGELVGKKMVIHAAVAETDDVVTQVQGTEWMTPVVPVVCSFLGQFV